MVINSKRDMLEMTKKKHLKATFSLKMGGLIRGGQLNT
jgi:hypothetical protein